MIEIMNRFFRRGLYVSLFVAALACKEAPVVEQVDTYDSMVVTVDDAVIESRFSASIRGRQDIQIMPQVSGTISKVCVAEGDVVRSGQTLFIIDQVPYKAALQTAEANVKAAKTNVSIADITLKSKQELYNREVISEYELRMAENQLLAAEAQLLQAEAQRINASNSLSYTEVKAPANGVVGTIPLRQGALVGPTMATPLTTVSDNSEMYVYFSMNETQLLKLTRTHGSMDAALAAFPKPKLLLSDGSEYEHEGYVESVSGVIDSNTGTVSLRAVFPNPGRILLSGSTGNILLHYYEKDCIVIPCVATYEVQDKTFVYVPVEGKAKSRMVDVQRYDGVNYIVRSGLSVGDVIITEGVAMLRDGAPVQLSRNVATLNDNQQSEE